MNEQGESVMEDISISINDMDNSKLKMVFEKNGRFQIQFPEELQRSRYSLNINHSKYENWRDYVYPSTNKDVHVVLKKSSN